MNTRTNFQFQFGNIVYDLASRTHIMGILNATPDSFSDGGKYLGIEEAAAHGAAMEKEGADFIDVGGESTRPGSEPVGVGEEIRRTTPLIERLKKEVKVPISIDTTKAEVADAALSAGAVMINDISGFTFDSQMADVAARHRATAVLMHTKGKPKTMQANPIYENVIEEVLQFLSVRAEAAKMAGVNQIIIDPGIGFGKTFDHNILILKELSAFRTLGYPLLVGPSRKSFIGAILNLPPNERLEGTAAAAAACVFNGAQILRVHDVQAIKRISLVCDVLKPAAAGEFRKI
jgi:dihydropteroate synthase